MAVKCGLSAARTLGQRIGHDGIGQFAQSLDPHLDSVAGLEQGLLRIV
jgi:hypothetical protein